MAELSIAGAKKVHDNPAIVSVQLSGAIEAAGHARLEKTLLPLEGKGVRLFVLDLAGIRFVNEIDRLADFHRRLADRGGGISLVSVPPKIRVILGTLGLDKILAIRGTIEEGVGALLEGQPDRREFPERRREPDRRRKTGPAALANRRAETDRRRLPDRRAPATSEPRASAAGATPGPVAQTPAGAQAAPVMSEPQPAPARGWFGALVAFFGGARGERAATRRG